MAFSEKKVFMIKKIWEWVEVYTRTMIRRETIMVPCCRQGALSARQALCWLGGGALPLLLVRSIRCLGKLFITPFAAGASSAPTAVGRRQQDGRYQAKHPTEEPTNRR